MTGQAAVIRHVAFEDLGSFAPVLECAGYRIRYVEAGVDALDDPDLANADLLIILGAPISVYQEEQYPFLADEIALLERRLGEDRPTLGICLGAQLVARALGGRVYPSRTKEIGWGPVILTDAGLEGPLAHLRGISVLHWHGDTFDLPDDCTLLASTEICRHQAFARDRIVLALQFHPEAEHSTFERWLIGHAVELAAAGIDPADLRTQADVAAPALVPAASSMLESWLGSLRA